MKVILFFAAISALVLSACQAFAQGVPADSTFYSPIFAGNTQSFQASAGAGDDTAAVNSAISSLASLGGGVLSFDAGAYLLRDVDLQSNVHLRFNVGSTVSPFPITGTGNVPIFKADSNSGPLTNFSIEGVGGSFAIDMTNHGPSDKVRAVTFGHAENFRVANFDVQDNNTVHSVLAFGANYTRDTSGSYPVLDTVRGVPSGGIIENVSVTDAHYGYGMVQVQGGNNLLFRDMAAEGGVALRLETGFELLQFATPAQAAQLKLDNIYGRNLSSLNGHAALMLSPHTLDHGTVDMADISAVSSETAVKWGAGFVSTSTGDQVAAGLTPGSFASDSKIRNVTATFGQDAQLKSQRMRYIPCELRHERVNGVGIATDFTEDGQSKRGPAVAAVLRTKDSDGDYELDFPISEVTASGFMIDEHALPENAFFIDAYDDYEHCTEVVSGTSFFVPQEYRNTPNRRVFASTGKVGDFDGDDDVDTDDIDFYSGLIGVDSGDSNYDFRLDFDNNGVIELADHNFHVNTYVETSNGITGALLGDMDLTGDVDILGDAAILVERLNGAGPYSYAMGDLNADLQVDILGDAAILVAMLGQNTNSSATSPATSSVPEPTGLVLLVLATTGICSGRFRTGSR